jgi:hypothetical protein
MPLFQDDGDRFFAYRPAHAFVMLRICRSMYAYMEKVKSIDFAFR